jgi:hypothetical protein
LEELLEAIAKRWRKPKEAVVSRCDEMREGDVFYCEHCGLEIEVIEECSHEEGDEADEVCRVEEFVCCGEAMTLKEE